MGGGIFLTPPGASCSQCHRTGYLLFVTSVSFLLFTISPSFLYPLRFHFSLRLHYLLITLPNPSSPLPCPQPGTPSSRTGASFWVDGSGTPWMFGGSTRTSVHFPSPSPSLSRISSSLFSSLSPLFISPFTFPLISDLELCNDLWYFNTTNNTWFYEGGNADPVNYTGNNPGTLKLICFSLTKKDFPF